MVDLELKSTLVAFGLDVPLINIPQLQDDFNQLAAIIRQGPAASARPVSSVSMPGVSTSWAPVGMTIYDYWCTLNLAIRDLKGTPTVMRRTSARYF